MEENSSLVTMRGNPVTLVGPQLETGAKAPDFVAVDNDLQPAKLSTHAGKVVVISAVPSLDTPVCEIETQRFNHELESLGDDVVGLTISMDLPFAQKRWCGANGVTRMKTVSDHRDAAFGESYGVLIKELRLLARAVFVVDRDDVIRYKELVPEIANEPDYGAAMKAIKDCL